MPQSNNPYLKEIHSNIERILSLYNPDQLSPYYGVGDRDYWGWKTKDFVNGTYQGAAHGFSLLLKHNLLPAIVDKQEALALIQSIFLGTKSITRSDGSLEESYPYESSFCVTSLVAFDLSSALFHLQEHLSEDQKKSYKDIIAPLISFTIRRDEQHGIISNHLASAAAALSVWKNISGTKVYKENTLVDKILENQSSEGWLSEYGGADIGYQTLATSYLSVLMQHSPDNKRLQDALQKSIAFLQWFIHPDGSVGGIYSNRNTEFYYPDGLEYFAERNDLSKTIACIMRRSIIDGTCVTLSSIDAPNLIPTFNSYCRAAVIYENHKAEDPPPLTLPSQEGKAVFMNFEHAGLVLSGNSAYYAIFSTKKGGAGIVCNKKLNTAHYDYGPLYATGSGKKFTTQGNESKVSLVVSNDFKTIEITAPLREYKKMYPTALQYIVLRSMNLTIMRIPALNELVKKILVKFVIKGENKTIGTNKRTINFMDSSVSVKDDVCSTIIHELQKVDGLKYFSIHMASQGYWKRRSP